MPDDIPEAGDLTRHAAAHGLGCSLKVIDDLIARGTLQSYKFGPSRRHGRRVTRESYDALRSGRVQWT